MRTAFARALTDLAGRDRRITLITGDLGFGVMEGFARSYPGQFLNIGVAEQNMTSVAAGMALSGRIVFTYSIGNFPTLRCVEQIRNDVCYHRADVKVVTVGGGFAYGTLGISHHATEDMAIMRALPNMVVVAPGDPIETAAAVLAVAARAGPCYLRLGRAGERNVHGDGVAFELGRAIMLRDGGDVTLISTGGMLERAMRAAERLDAEGVRARVLSMHTVKPLDADAVVRAARETGGIVTIEEHSVIGGLGSAVADALVDSGVPGVRFRRVALPAGFAAVVGSQDYLRDAYGLSEDAVVAVVRQVVESRSREMSAWDGRSDS
ncbi:MAG: transketolase family protein [Gemmatimonadales bacterium]